MEAAYPLSAYNGSPQAAFIQADADAYVICPALSVAQYAADAKVPIWSYEFAHFHPSSVDPGGGGCDNGVELDLVSPVRNAVNQRWATHGADIQFVRPVILFAHVTHK